MGIKGNSLRSLGKVFAAADGLAAVRFGFDAVGKDPAIWERLGFPREPQSGETLMPGAGGKVASFNAQGREVIRKDLPMEKKSMTVWSSWKDWHGNPHSGTQSRDVERYPRDYIPAPSEAITAFDAAGRLIFATETVSPEREEDRALHLANLMLECFGEFDVMDATAQMVVGAHAKKLQWDVLPAGQYPWDRVQPIVQQKIAHLPEGDRRVVESRLATIARAHPDFFATGNGGFNGYFVYGFTGRDIYVLESTHLDNATYVFRSDWEDVSQLTKNDIIRDGRAHARLIHDRAWQTRIFGLIAGR